MAETQPVTTTPPGKVSTLPRLTWLDGALVFLMLIWGANFVVIKTALAGMTPIVFNALRFSLATVVLGILFKLNGARLRLPRREWLPLIGVAAFGVFYQALFTYGLHNTSVANNALIVATCPVWVVLINIVRGQERISRTAIIGVFVALLGVGVVVMTRETAQGAAGPSHLLGDGISLIASWVWAVSILYSYKPLQRNPTLPATFWVIAWSALLMLVFALPELPAVNWSSLGTRALAPIVYAGLVSMGLGSVIWNRAVKQIGTSRTAVYTYLEPIVAALTAILFLGESFTIWLVVGTALVIGGLIFVKKA